MATVRNIVAAFATMYFLSSSAFAQLHNQRIGDWAVDISGTYSEAYTSNSSGSSFGLLCIDSCTFYLDSGIQCTENAKTPFLVNADSGSTFVISSCIHFPQNGRVRYVNSIQDKDVVTAIASGQIIGFAIPLESGDFKVVRFSLNGALQTTALAVKGLEARPKSRNAILRDKTM
jgi:hypothetical protein